ncbi:low molecular weight phosphotyrosine protein phosphatase [Aestuariibacter sp. AA17]|uniref:protein-tyrosine-phosphatase n=1 Tax=Fluctibacter corallii TaxID=2984329 RepID=A0ABT3ABD4_9ALTE|nr:low molecular weight protein-tyrosine-phosphatase [Aestuariibacter sp. AA17]MCV2885983.1 low molecular weight phosphotyrosine protein phosphatase [Aestuariibacter sp. AA17]
MANTIDSVLFVCMGNICRSPTAEAVFRHKADMLGLQVRIDSAGTIGHHEGSPPDERSRQAGEARGYNFDNMYSRKVVDTDFEEFDLIICMDEDNLRNLQGRSPDAFSHKLVLMMDYANTADSIVPDPYFGGSKGFEYVLDLIEAASDGLVVHIREQAGIR